MVYLIKHLSTNEGGTFVRESIYTGKMPANEHLSGKRPPAMAN